MTSRVVSVVLHNGPTVHTQEAMSLAVIDVSKEAGVKRFVLCSELHPMRTKSS